MKSILSIVLFSISFLISGITLAQQNLPDSVRVIKVTHKEKGKTFYVFENEKVGFKLIGQEKDKIQKGLIKYISSQGVMIDDSLYKLESISVLMNKTQRRSRHFRSASTTAAGALLASAGIASLLLNEGTSTDVVGIVGLASGIPVMAWGIIKYLKGNHYDRDKGWEYSTFQVVNPWKDFEEEFY